MPRLLCKAEYQTRKKRKHLKKQKEKLLVKFDTNLRMLDVFCDLCYSARAITYMPFSICFVCCLKMQSDILAC